MNKNTKKKKYKKVELGNMGLEDIREQNLEMLNEAASGILADSSSCSDPGGGGVGGGGA